MKNLRFLLAFIGVVLFVVPVVIIYEYYSLFGHLEPSTDPKHWGEFGSFLGGVAGPFVTALSVFFLGVGLIYQVQSQNKSRDLMEGQLAALVRQNLVAEGELKHKKLMDVMDSFRATIAEMEVAKGYALELISGVEKRINSVNVWSDVLSHENNPEYIEAERAKIEPLNDELKIHEKNFKGISERLRWAKDELYALQVKMITEYKNSETDGAG